ncbi:MAG TPA: response regulator [Candidatus Sulfopaludibacter sp.]|nr:response regulator [Candidatus Sulfopaludibacter sp.]
MTRLLVAEDDEFSRDMLVRRLERQGYEVISAADGREALQAARVHKPDLILMDLDMPVMDGRQAMSALRSDPRTFKTPIIVLTAHASPEDVAAAVDAGCRSYETKPVVIRRLVERIEEALGHTPPGPAET